MDFKHFKISICITSFSNASKSFGIYGGERREREAAVLVLRERWWGVFSSSNHNVCLKMTRERVWVNPPCSVHAEQRACFHETRKWTTLRSFSIWKSSDFISFIWTLKNNFKSFRQKKEKVETTLVIGNNQTIFLFLMFRDWFLNSFYWVSFCNPIEHSKEYLLLKG